MSHRILIIEDDQHFAAQLKELFEFHGHVALHAATGPAGIEMAEESHPDLLIVDLMLPEVHGIRVLEEIRVSDVGRDVPALLMSAVYKNESLFTRDMKRLGVLGFLSKPFSLIDLGRKVNGILAEPTGGRERTRALRGLSARRPDKDSATGTHYSLSTGTDAPKARPDWDRQTASAPVVPPDRGPSPAPQDGPADSGRLDAQGYVRLLVHLFHSHASGRLHLHTEPSDKTTYFLNGYPVWVQTRPVAFLEWLKAEGLVSDAVAETLRRDSEPDWNPSSALVAQGVVAVEDVPPLLEGWVAHEVRGGLSHSGTYSFEHVDDFSGLIPVFEVNPLRQIWQAVRQLDLATLERELSELAGQGREIGRTRTFNRLFGYLGTTPGLRSLGEHLLRPRSLDDVRAQFADDREDVTRCLWLLISAGLVALADAAPTSSAGGRTKSGGPSRSTSARSQAPSRGTKSAVETDRHGRQVVDSVRRAPSPGVGDTPVARIARDYVTRMELTHYEFLGVAPTVTLEEIDEAYRALAPAYRLRNLGVDVQSETRRQAKELLTRLVQAFGELSDPARRLRYDGLLARAARGGRRPGGQVSRPAAGVPKPKVRRQAGSGAQLNPLHGYPGRESDHRLRLEAGRLGPTVLNEWTGARDFIKSGEFVEAYSILQGLRSSLPSEPGLLADMAWCRLNLGNPLDPRNIDKALEWVRLAEAFELGHADVVEVHARIMVGSDDDEGAIRAFKRALKRRPELTWAKTELENRQSREKKDASSTGLFGGLFGKGKGGRR
jgi:CheY-like chemotaxis protein